MLKKNLQHGHQRFGDNVRMRDPNFPFMTNPSTLIMRV